MKPYTIITHLSDGTDLEWGGSVFSYQIRDDAEGHMLAVLNGYWANRPVEEIHAWEEAYRSLHTYMMEYAEGANRIRTDVSGLISDLQSYVNGIVDCIPFNPFKMHSLNRNYVCLDNGIKEELSEIDHKGTTYFTDDYRDLIVLSIAFKAMMPFIGEFHHQLGKAIGTPFVHMRCMDILKATALSEWPAWDKLENFCENYTAQHITQVAYSLISGLAGDEIPKLLFSIAVIKKVTTFDVYKPGESIIANIYSLFKQRGRDINRTRPSDKMLSHASIDKDDKAMADHYKILRMTTPGHVAMIQLQFTDDKYNLLRAIIPEIDVTRLDFWHSKVDDDYDIMPCHYALVGILIPAHISDPRSLLILHREAFINAASIAAAVAEHMGYPDVADFLVSSPIQRDMYTVSLSHSQRLGKTSYSTEKITELTEMFRYKSQDVNQPLEILDIIMADVSILDWSYLMIDSNEFRGYVTDILLDVNRRMLNISAE